MKNFFKHVLKDFILFIIFGCIYTNFELVWRNYTDVRMILVGGLCGLFIGLINEFTPKMKLAKQCLISTVIVLVIEFISGYYFNIIKGLNIWDYSDLPLNIMGQVCLPYAILWFFLSILAIYLDDFLRWKLFGEEEPERFSEFIKKLFK